MRIHSIAITAALAAIFSAIACGGSTSNGTTTTGGAGGAGGTGGAGATTGTGGGPPAASCTKPGDKGNDIGVGEYCTPGGGQCAQFPKAGLCLADVGQDQWFCTRIGCTMDADCGTAAHCHLDPAGAGCVPNKCEPPGTGGGGGGGPGDAGTD